MAGVGGLLAFFTVVASSSGCRSTPSTRAIEGLGAALTSAQGPEPVRLERLLRLPLRLLAAAGRARGPLLPLPEALAAGRLLGSDQSPNLLGTERTGPDLSQESGWHPDDWQRAHFYDPRYMDPKSLMPDMKSLFSDKQVEDLVAFVEQRSGKSGLLRYAGQLYAKHVVLANQGFPHAYTGFWARTSRSSRRSRREAQPTATSSRRRPTSPRSTAATGSPATRSRDRGNLMRGKEVFLDRCVGCHGSKGDGKGPGAKFLSPPPADFTDKDDACCGGDTGPGRLLLPHPARLAGYGDGELRRPALGQRHLARRAVHQDDPERDARANRIPEPSDYIVWQPSKELLAWTKSHQTLPGQRELHQEARHRPVHAGGDAGLPGPGAERPADAEQPGAHAALAQAAAAGIKALYEDMLNRAWADRRARGEKLPPPEQKDVPPTVPGQQ